MSGRVVVADGTDAERREVHLPGLTWLDTTTLCGSTWPNQVAPDTSKLTCKACKRVLGEMRSVVREHRGIKVGEP